MGVVYMLKTRISAGMSPSSFSLRPTIIVIAPDSCAKPALSPHFPIRTSQSFMITAKPRRVSLYRNGIHQGGNSQ